MIRKILSVANTAALQSKGSNDALQVLVEEYGIFEFSSSGSPDGDSIFGANGTGVWVLKGDMRARTNPPDSITLTSPSFNQVNASWSAVSGTIAYYLERATNIAFSDAVLIYTGTNTSFSDTGRAESTTYYYRVQARKASYARSGFTSGSVTTPSNAAGITANRVAEFNFLGGSGQIAFNEVGGNTVDKNLIHPSMIQWDGETNLFVGIYNSSETTFTNNYAVNADGVQQMRRVQTLSGSTINGSTGAYAGVRIQGQTFPAGTYKLSLEVKSNTGVSQYMRMLVAGGTISGDLEVTPTPSRVSYTITHPGGSPIIYFCINGSAGTPLDVSIDKIYLGPTDGDYVNPKYDLKFGRLGTTGTDEPTWLGTRGLGFLGDGKFAYGLSTTPATLTNISIHVAAKINAASATWNQLLGTTYSDGGFEMIGGVGNNNVETLTLPRVKYRNATAGAKLSRFADGLTHYFTMTYDGTTLKFYVDKILMAQTTASLTSFVLSKLIAGYSSSVGGVGGNFEMYYAAIFSEAHTLSQVTSQYNYVKGQLAGAGISMDMLSNVLFVEGDSITIDVNSYARKGVQAMTTSLYADNIAQVGSTVTGTVSLDSRKAQAVAWLNQADFAGKNKILSVFAGANDLTTRSGATFVADLKTYCQYMKANVSGLKIVVVTPLPNTTGATLTNRAAAIPLILGDASYYDAIVRFDQVSGMGADADCTNTTNYPDGVHPSNVGHNLLYPSWKTVIESLLL